MSGQKACIWTDARRSGNDSLDKAAEASSKGPEDIRSVFQVDYDRLLFSAPVRRLSDKTQVWPMDENDGVRTRLTHSHEVANLARSIGTRVYERSKKYFKTYDGNKVSLYDVVQPMLLAIGLGHDLGNPPFGHQGELAIGNWFKAREDWIFSYCDKGKNKNLQEPVSEEEQREFTHFDGNPQSVRILSSLQSHANNFGLDLSAATLAAGLKYPVSYRNVDDDCPLAKKGGYFTSEIEVIEWVRQSTGLLEKQRHPLTWIMEACDDIAYSVLDIDDVLKKEMVSPNDILNFLKLEISISQPNGQETKEKKLIEKIQVKFLEVDNKFTDLPEMSVDIKTQYLRAYLIENLIQHASDTFVNNAKGIFDYSLDQALMEGSELCKALKNIAKKIAFSHPAVLRAEALGAVAIDGLMTELWEAISDRKDFNELKSRRLTARSKYIYSLISPNYIYQATRSESLGMRYRELRLLTDMISGMTDTFAIRFWENLKKIPKNASGS